MTDRDVSPQELARRYLVTHDYRAGLGPKPQRAYRALTIWEEWIVSAPDKAWGVFEELVRLRPDDDDVLEQLCKRLESLLSEHWGDFHERVTELVVSNPRLTRIMPQAALQSSYYAPKYRTLPELADAWLEYVRQFSDAHLLDELIRDDPDRALPLALEVIHRAPSHQFNSFDVMSPLLELLRRHGSSIIDDVVAAAADSVAVRRVLWRMRRQQPDEPGPATIPQEVWTRVLRAAGDTTDYNCDDPPAVVTSLTSGDERIIASWFVSEDKRWASAALQDLVRDDPENAWVVIGLLVERADEDVLGSIAAGPLEDLLREHGAAMVSRVEAKARRDPVFKQCLGGVWLDARDVPEDVVRRLHAASEGELLVFEPTPTPPEILDLERVALTMLLAGEHKVLEALREQWRRSTVVRRNFGSGGIDVEFSVPADVPAIPDAAFVTIGDVWAEVHFLDQRLTFHLTIEDGRLESLNCSLYEEWPAPVLVKRVYYVRRDEVTNQDVETPERDMARFHARWGS
jgi:hypothetical protein